MLKGKWQEFVNDMKQFSYWRKTRSKNADSLHTHVPWLAFGAIDYLQHWLTKEMKVFEYGSGSSTLFFAERTQTVISIEHNEEWYLNGEAHKQKHNIQNIEYRLFLPKPQAEKKESCHDPNSYTSCMGEYNNFSFREYVLSVEEFPDESFDLIVIDGRARPSCILHSMKKVKVNGILLLDNADRNYYLQPFPELFNKNKWSAQTFIGHLPYNPPSVLDTTILFTKKN